MNKKQFLQELEEHLIGIDDREEILQDYKEHFSAARKKKRSEKEVVKSLGDPKEIARQIRAELSDSDRTDLAADAVEAWVATKHVCKRLFTQAAEGLDRLFSTEKRSTPSKIAIAVILVIALLIAINNPFLTLLLVAVVAYYDHSQRSPNKKKDRQVSKLRLTVSIVFNVFFLWFWISVFAVIIAFFAASIALIVSGVAVAIYAAVSLMTAASVLVNVLWSAVFAGIAVTLIGVLLFWATQICTRGYLWTVKKYIQLNKEFIRA